MSNLTGIATAALITLPALAACSSSSSSGAQTSAKASAAASASAEASASARASALGVTPIPSLKPGGHGPNGDITAPASNSPSTTSPGGSVVFPHVSEAQRQKLANHLVNMAGVQTVTYYPQYHQLQVYFTADATQAQKQAVTRYVTNEDPAAAG